MAESRTPTEILDIAYKRAENQLATPIITDEVILDRVSVISRNLQNRAAVRLILAALLAKIHDPAVDIRKPYTEIGGADSYSGRAFDERYITSFINDHDLPCNSTTAF